MLLNRRVFVSPLAFRMGLTGLKMRFGLGDLDRGTRRGFGSASCRCSGVFTMRRAPVRLGVRGGVLTLQVAELHAEGF